MEREMDSRAKIEEKGGCVGEAHVSTIPMHHRLWTIDFSLFTFYFLLFS